MGDWDSESLWIDKVWQDLGVVYLDEEHYDKYLSSNGGNDKNMWVVAGMRTPFSNNSYSTENYDGVVKKLMCLKKAYGNINVGFYDYYKNERVHESFSQFAQNYGSVVP